MRVILRASINAVMVSMLFVCCTDGDNPFEVTVVDTDGTPVIGARITGGMDWDYYSVLTDSMGVAVLPGYARGEPATITQDNFFPLAVQAIVPRQYVFTPTTQQLRLIGRAEGTAIIFETGNLVTLEYSGDYHVYTYDDQNITEIATDLLPATMKKSKLFGDVLWYTTHDDGIYVYSLENPYQPQLLFHLAITGYLGAFAVEDSIVAVGNPYGGPFRIFSYSLSGQCQELASISEFVVDEMTIRDNYAILVGGETSMPTVFDITDPTQPILVHNNLEPGAQTGLILDTVLVIVPRASTYVTGYTYKLLKILFPSNPWSIGIFSANAWLYDVINNEYAVGDYGGYYATAVLVGNISDGFATVALITEAPSILYGGSRPPYFLIDDNLWILEER